MPSTSTCAVPDYLLDGCLALSGIYTAKYGFGDYMDEVVYQNSPVDYMAQLPHRSPLYGPLPQPGRRSSAAVRALGNSPIPPGSSSSIFEAEGHPCLGGPVGPRRQARLGLVVSAGRVLHALYSRIRRLTLSVKALRLCQLSQRASLWQNRELCRDCQGLPLWGRWHCVSNDGEGFEDVIQGKRNQKP